jgi:predicted ester cyclase
VTRDELAAFYRRYNAACNDHRFDDFAEFVSPDVTINDTGRGLEDYTGGLRAVTDAFPDFRWELRHLVLDPPWVAAHLTDTGTHRGTFGGVEPTGRAVTIEEFAVYRIQDGRIAEVWGQSFDENLRVRLASSR